MSIDNDNAMAMESEAMLVIMALVWYKYNKEQLEERSKRWWRLKYG